MADTVAEVSEIVVKGEALRGPDKAFSTTTFDTADIKARSVTEIEQLFREVPGMNARDYHLSGVANQIVLRGFGNGGHGGDLGMVIDGIPLNEANSHADGYVDTNVLTPLEIGGFTVYRGPVSAMYGNFNRGGLIAFETRKGGDYLEADVSGARFATFDVQAALGAPVGAIGHFNGAIQAARSDGFRPQSENRRFTAAGRYALAVSDRLDASVALRLHAAEGDSPAYLTFDQFRRDPYGIDPRTMNDGSEKTFGTLRGDVAYTLTPDVRLLVFAYATRQDFTRWFTRGAAAPTALWRQREEAYQRKVHGAGASLNGRAELAGREVGFVAGAEAFEESTEFQFHDDLVFRRRVNPAISDRESEIRSLSAFGEANVAVAPRLELSLGVRYDRFTGECALKGPETGTDPCGPLKATDDLSAKIGARSQLTPWLQVRTSYSEGFALVTGFGKYAPGAQNLDPNSLRQIEAGVRLTPFEGRLELDLVGYEVESSNEFASTAPGVFVNFGATRRTGVEASLKWRPVDSLDLAAVYASADSKVIETRDAALLGKSVTGVPDETLTLTATWRPTPRLRFNATYRYVGPYAADAANTLRSPSYDLVDLGASYDLEGLAVPTRVYASVDNVGDVVYASSFNSLSSVATGAPRTLRVGVQVGF
ncbi:MAG: TonB-dependent receptor [Phenylobacterium sp.]|nr:TonB-dependent receptor [Phenylobacterium sp.]